MTRPRRGVGVYRAVGASRPDRSSAPLAGYEDQVLPVHGGATGAAVEPLGEQFELSVQRRDTLGILGDGLVDGDRRPVVGLEVVAPFGRRLEAVDRDALPARGDVADAVTEQRADVVLVAPTAVGAARRAGAAARRASSS